MRSWRWAHWKNVRHVVFVDSMGIDSVVLMLLASFMQGTPWVESQVTQQLASNCQSTEDCGWRATCENATCTCHSDHILHLNGRDCKNESCSATDCLECFQPDICYRCVKFILADDRSCVDQCNGVADVVMDESFQGNICKGSDKTNIIIGVVAGVGSALILCMVIILVVCVRIRKRRKNVSLQKHHYKPTNMEMGSVKQFPSYINHAFVAENVKMGVIDPDVYATQLEELRPHTHTLMQLLSQIRPKLRAMDSCDPRIPTYKGVIHQLCRVLVLLHRQDNGSSIPSDALGLIEWAQQMLEDHRQQQELQPDPVGPDVLGDLGQGKISYIDVDVGTNMLPSPVVYAQPLGMSNESLHSDSSVNPYSSVPVPLFQDSAPDKSQKTYATIHRSPSVPSAINSGKSIYGRSTLQKGNDVAKGKNRITGYFANGRYYDPNPTPQPEIYAPASSYSDRSTVLLTTFVPDRPRSRSLSTSEASSDGEPVDGEGSDEDYDVFPFDPKEATDPVEV